MLPRATSRVDGPIVVARLWPYHFVRFVDVDSVDSVASLQLPVALHIERVVRPVDRRDHPGQAVVRRGLDDSHSRPDRNASHRGARLLVRGGAQPPLGPLPAHPGLDRAPVESFGLPAPGCSRGSGRSGRDTIAFAPLRRSPLNSRFATCRRFRSTSPSRPRRLGCTTVVSLSRLLPSTSASIVSRPRRRSAGSGSCDVVYHPRLASSSALLMTVSRSSCLVARTVAQERLTPATGDSPGRRRGAA